MRGILRGLPGRERGAELRVSSDDDITPRYHRGLTLFLALVLCSFLCLSGTGKNLGPIHAFDHPAATAREHFERRIELADALAQAPEWKRRALALITGELGSAREEALVAWSDVIAAQSEALQDPKPAQPAANDAAATSASGANASRGVENAPDAGARDPQASDTTPGSTGAEAATSPAPLPPQTSSTREGAASETPAPNAPTPSSDGGGFLACAPSAPPKPPLKDDRATLTELLARLAILQGESQRLTEFGATRLRLERLGAVAIADALDHAYRPFAERDDRTFESFDLSLLQAGWARDRLETRLADRTQATERIDAAKRAHHAREVELSERADRLLLAALVAAGLGLIVLLAWLLWNRPALPTASASVPPAWSFEDGFAVVTRAFLYGLVLATIVALARPYVPEHLEPAIQVVSLIVFPLPAVYLIRRGLLLPRGSSFAHSFGLRGLARPGWAWVLVVLALFAADQVGSALILDLCDRIGERADWTDLVHEWIMRPGAVWTAAIVALAVTWFPLAGEIFGRGVLFLTLRSRMAAVTAALWSAALAAAFQNASLPGFLSYVWSGFLYALAVEHTRSLWPSIVCLALGQALAFAFALQLA